MKKFRIEKNSVQETLLIPLYGKKVAAQMYPDLFDDTMPIELWSKIDYDMIKQPQFKIKVGAIMAATRQYDLATVCRRYLAAKPRAAVVNLGCGLDTTFNTLANGLATGYNLDLAEVMEVRNELLPPTEMERNIAVDLTDYSWFEKIDFNPEKGAVFFASGVFYYFKRAAVRDLLINMAKAFPGAKIVFDATNAKGLKKMLKTWLNPVDMVDVGVYFSLEDVSEIKAWSADFKSVTRRGYMTGYRSLDKRYGFLANLLFKYVDNANLGSIIEIEFNS